MSDARSYVVSLLEESMGLARGTLDPSLVGEDLVVEFSLALKGAHPSGLPTPALEERMMELLATVREKGLRDDGFFVRKLRWPGGAPFAVCLTHDVETSRIPEGTSGRRGRGVRATRIPQRFLRFP